MPASVQGPCLYVKRGECRCGRVSVPSHGGLLLCVPLSCFGLQRISHGSLDVNRLAVMPQQPNILATCCDDPEVRMGVRALFGLGLGGGRVAMLHRGHVVCV